MDGTAMKTWEWAVWVAGVIVVVTTIAARHGLEWGMLVLGPAIGIGYLIGYGVPWWCERRRQRRSVR